MRPTIPSQLMNTGRCICTMAVEAAKVIGVSSSFPSLVLSDVGGALICRDWGEFCTLEIGVVEELERCW